jgi:hypothetical protein
MNGISSLSDGIIGRHEEYIWYLKDKSPNVAKRRARRLIIFIAEVIETMRFDAIHRQIYLVRIKPPPLAATLGNTRDLRQRHVYVALLNLNDHIIITIRHGTTTYRLALGEAGDGDQRSIVTLPALMLHMHMPRSINQTMLGLAIGSNL